MPSFGAKVHDNAAATDDRILCDRKRRKADEAAPVKELTDSAGNVVTRFEPEMVRTVISKQTSDIMRDILEGVVADPKGTGNNAYVRGYRVGGKTGTSETTKEDVYIASFCGFGAPADDPKIVVLVALFDPRESPTWAESLPLRW